MAGPSRLWRTRRIAALGSMMLGRISIVICSRRRQRLELVSADAPRGKTPTAPRLIHRSGQFDRRGKGAKARAVDGVHRSEARRRRSPRRARRESRRRRRSRGRPRAGRRICAGRFRCNGRRARQRRRAGSRSPGRESRPPNPGRPSAWPAARGRGAGPNRRCGGSRPRRRSLSAMRLVRAPAGEQVDVDSQPLPCFT